MASVAEQAGIRQVSEQGVAGRQTPSGRLRDRAQLNPYTRVLVRGARDLWSKLSNPTYRREESELARLRALPPCVSTVTDLLGFPIELVDAPSFLAMYTDIFRLEHYRFQSQSPCPYIIDGGANIGLITLYFRKLYPGAKIIAFEPDPQIFGVLERNVQGNGFADVTLVRSALWISKQKLRFTSDGSWWGRMSRGGDASDQEVETVRLRDYLDRPVDLLKLDIEGAEAEVLHDCGGALARVRNLFVEYHSFAGERQKISGLLQLLSSAGFRLYFTAPDSSPQPLIERRVEHEIDAALNIFAVRET